MAETDGKACAHAKQEIMRVMSTAAVEQLHHSVEARATEDLWSEIGAGMLWHVDTFIFQAVRG